MKLLVDDEDLGTYLAYVQDSSPSRLTIEGLGGRLGKAAWLVLVLETEYGYDRRQMDLSRVKRGHDDLARITATLEARRDELVERERDATD